MQIYHVLRSFGIGPVSARLFLAGALVAFAAATVQTAMAQPGKNPISARGMVTPSAVKPQGPDPRQFWKFFETDQNTVERNGIDKIVFPSLRKQNLEPAPLCSDSVFVRRVYYDLIGYPPSFNDTYNFLKDNNKNKRAKLIDKLLDSPDYSDYWAMKWCDLLRIKAEFPINLWPAATMAYYRWVHESLRTNKPYDVMARQLLLGDGSNFRDPTANFYRAVSPRTPEGRADAVARTFMGTRLANLNAEQRKSMIAFFSRIDIKKSAEWKEEIVYWNRKPLDTPMLVFPGGKTVTVAPDQDPREVFADWLVSPNNQIFNFNIVNRIWYWLMGRGIVQEPDDFRVTNPPVHAELLPFLEQELVESKYDLKQVFRVIMNSHIYQQSSIARADYTKSEQYFAVFPIRRFDAEVLQDSFVKIFGIKFTYKSEVPEPFTYIPSQVRTVMVYDSGITNEFLETFARASRDSGMLQDRINRTSQSQQLYFLNSTDMNNWTKKLIDQIRSYIPRGGDNSPAEKQEQLAKVVWMTLLCRIPTTAEVSALRQVFGANRQWTENDVHDMIWAVVNTKEFLCQH